jgi:MFS family permease
MATTDYRPSDEKKFDEQIEDVASQPSDIDHDEVYSPAEQKKIIHRVDRRLVSMCGLMYCVSLMDRTNLSAAAIAGMTKELRLDIGFRYSTVILVFFVTYVIFQPPATVLTKKIGPRLFLATITLVWGGIMIAFGFVKDWAALAGLRILLGVLEAGFFPGAVFLMSTWYVRYDMQKRYSVFYIIGCVAAAFSGILAYGLMQMNGLANLGGWRWIFIIEGVISCLVAISGYLFLVDFPETGHKSWNFLSRAECDFIMRRIDKDRGDAHTEPFTIGRFLRPALDFKIWLFALLFW